MNEIDEELATFIEKAMAESKDCCEALDKVVEWEKNRGLIGIRIGAPLDVMCGQREVEDPRDEANKIAKDALLLLLASAQGKLKEVTPEELEGM